ncbi:katanin p80 WD40 repeat-containing subunit B1 homolog KTN80.1-like isoform X4 [Gossypium arboreum]|nr:katanin p80 WD40 repeat-containing subunit B1 homolog KTN80.1-like isoform X4 [Gossypium arboreum]
MDFHPFGEFFASGSMDKSLKIWDIRKKGCIHTYKSHTRGISSIRFSPDGRWVVSGGFDNVVKVWDLTAGKLLNEFKFHEGHIRSINFHPLEFLLATGSADRTVKFWDLETFELIGSSKPEAKGARSVTFHPDGKTLFCGSDDGFKVYSWEPIVCHNSADMGWSTLGDLCINKGKLLGCSYYRNSVGVWIADIAHIVPFGQKDHMEKAGNFMRSTLGSRPLSPDYETKEIKNIYVDTAGGYSVVMQKAVFLKSPKPVLPLNANEKDQAAENQSPGAGLNIKSNGQSGDKSVTKPSVVLQDVDNFSGTKSGMLLKPGHVRRLSFNNLEVEKLSAAVEPGTPSDMKTGLDSAIDLDSETRTSPNQDILAVVRGRTRSLVERFERQEKLNSGRDLASDNGNCAGNRSSRMESTCSSKGSITGDQISSHASSGIVTTISIKESTYASDGIISNQFSQREATSATITENHIPLRGLNSSNDENFSIIESQVPKGEPSSATDGSITDNVMQTHDIFVSTLRSRLTKLQVVRLFWEKNDIKGAIDALRKLPDHSVQVDSVSVFMQKMEILTLDLFSSLLPVLTGLLDSKIERHVIVSLEMLLKLVAVFGPVIRLTALAPRSVSVDLHGEQRRECCNQCSMQLEKIHKLLPLLQRRGGTIARCAHELNLVLQE